MDDLSVKFRQPILQSDSVAFGCSHTWGVGVEFDETWPYLLKAMNFGIGSSSGDQVVRIAEKIIPKNLPKIVYCLWPDWSRFKYLKDGSYIQSLPTDSDRIFFMQTNDDEWCRENFARNLKDMKNLCDFYESRLIDMTLYDLISVIDHADQWPLSKLGHHYSPEWHRWVADIFSDARDTNKKFPLAYE